MELATNYKPKSFNYSWYGTLLRKALKEISDEEDIKKIYKEGS